MFKPPPHWALLGLLLVWQVACAPAAPGAPAPTPTLDLPAPTATRPEPTATPRPSPAPATPTSPAGPQPTAESLFAPITDADWQKGPADARLTIIEYGDYQ